MTLSLPDAAGGARGHESVAVQGSVLTIASVAIGGCVAVLACRRMTRASGASPVPTASTVGVSR